MKSTILRLKCILDWRHLSFKICCFADAADGLWFLYFSNKLIYLKILCFSNVIEDFGLADQYDQRQFANWVSKLSNLECYHVQDFDITENIVKAMDGSGMQLKRIDLGCENTIGYSCEMLMDSKQKNTLETITLAGAFCESILLRFDFYFEI